jgi:hypothetical protein
MAYVPGFSTDVFLSYAHGDDPGWIIAFEQELAQRVRERLGHEIHVWRDARKLRVGHDWQREIGAAISSTAAFLAILSPSFRTSTECHNELTRFLPTGKIEDAMVGELCRVLKIVKIPYEHDDHDRFFRGLQHIKFFRRIDGPEEYVEFTDREFGQAIRETAASVVALLRTMCRQLQMVFVAAPADDLLDAWHKIRAQLRDDRYDVRPEGPHTVGFEDKVLLRDIEKAVVTVHLIGAAYDPRCERQLRLASEAGRRMLVWFAKETETRQRVDPRQWALIESIREMRDPTTRVDWFTGTVQEMIGQIQSSLRPKPVEPGSDVLQGTSVYLLHDATTPSDAAFALTLRADLRKQEHLNVVFPPPVLASSMDYRQRHLAQLQNCDGVLLYWNAAPETWFEQYVPDVLYQGRKARARTKAFLLDDPSRVGDQLIPVIRKSSDFCLTDLEPFLAPLRSDRASHVGV